MTDQKTLSLRAWIELTALSLIWGASFLSIRIALDELPVMTVVALRVCLAAPVLWAVALLRGRAVPKRLRVWAALLVMGALNNIIPFTLMAWGQLHIETGLVSILNATTAIFAVLVAAAMLSDERLSLRRLIGVLGVAVTIGLEALASLDLRSLAQLAVLAGAFSAPGRGGRCRTCRQRLPQPGC